MGEQAAVIVIMVVAFIPAIVLHECAHGYAAYKLGDPTAKREGRLTLNPLAHIDPFGTVVLPGLLIALSYLSGGLGMIFGYAKPVPYDPRYFEDIRKGELVVGLAGPVSNLLMSLVGAGIAWASSLLVGSAVDVAAYVWYFGVFFCQVNLALAFFNLIPLPPLDGSSIISVFLSERGMGTYYKVQHYAMPVFILVILVIPQFTGVNIVGWYLDVTAGNLAALLLP